MTYGDLVSHVKFDMERGSLFSYVCHACNRCCRNKAIRVSPYDILRLARYLCISTTQFIEYPALTRPCTMRRVFVDHNGMVWYALESAGKIGMLDPSTGKIVEYDEPVKWAFPGLASRFPRSI